RAARSSTRARSSSKDRARTNLTGLGIHAGPEPLPFTQSHPGGACMGKPAEFGVFLPMGRGGYILSTTRPETPGTYAHVRQITRLAEDLGLGFVIGQARWRGHGGPSKHWQPHLESVTAMAGLA